MSIFDGQPDDNSALAGLNPGWMGMLGLASGLGQGAMPSTHRGGIPFGAAMGMGATGMGQGMANAYKMQQEQAAAEGQRIQNEMIRPWVQTMRDPDALVKLLQGGGGSNAAPATSPQSAMPAIPSGIGGYNERRVGGGGDGNFSASFAPFAQQISEKTGLPADYVTAQAALESDNGKAPVATQKNNPFGLSDNNGVPYSYKTPQEGVQAYIDLMGNDRYKNVPRTGSPQEIGDAMAVAGYNPNVPRPGQTDSYGVRIGNRAASLGSYQLAGQPVAGSGGVPSPPPDGAPPPAAGVAGGGMPQDTDGLSRMSKDMMDRANQMDIINMLPAQIRLPALIKSGLQYQDPAALRTAAQQLRAAALAGPTERAKLLEQLKFAGPTELQKSLNKLDTDRYGNRYLGLTPLGRGSQLVRTWSDEKGQYVWKDVGAQTPQQAQSGGGPEVPAGPPLLQEHFAEGYGGHLAEQRNELDKAAAAAVSSNYLFDNMRNDAHTWSMGKFADIEGDARAWLSAASHAAGDTLSHVFGNDNAAVKALQKPEGLDKPLADYQAFLKSSGSLLRTAVHETSSRAAVQEYNMIGDTLPHPKTSEGAFHQVADQWQALNDWTLAKQKFARDPLYLRKPEDLNVDWNGHVSPTTFLLHRMSTTPQGQSDLHEMLARLSQSPEGRLAAAHMQQQLRYATEHNLFDDIPAAAVQR